MSKIFYYDFIEVKILKLNIDEEGYNYNNMPVDVIAKFYPRESYKNHLYESLVNGYLPRIESLTALQNKSKSAHNVRYKILKYGKRHYQECKIKSIT